MKNIAVFVSGGGSNLQNLIDAQNSGLLNAQIKLVVASKEGILAIEKAKEAKISVAVFDKNKFASAESMYDAIIVLLKKMQIELIVLAGYLNILTKNIVHEYKERIINVHPSLIPKYSGKGFYGLRIHNEVIKNKEKITGVTVHFVDEGTDTGKIIKQVEVAVLDSDTPESLQKRVLKVEHELLPRVINRVIGVGYEEKSVN